MAQNIIPAPSQGRVVEVGGLKLHYLDYGTEGKPPLVCLHGGQAHGHWYDFIAAEFTPDHHMIALDGRGHGDSAWSDPPDYTYERFAEDLAELLEKLDLREVTLIGHSVGGVVALLYAAKYHDRLKRLVIADSTLTTNAKRVEMMRGKASEAKQAYASREDLVAAYKLNPPNHHAPPEIIRHLALQDAEQGADGLWRQKFDPQFYAQRDWHDPYSSWTKVDVPVLLMKASDGGRVTDEIIAEVRSRCPQVQPCPIADCDHHIMLDQPEAFVAAIKAFIAES